jgi:hypothetical protein
VAVALLLLLATIAAVPFLLTTQLVNRALAWVVPAHDARVGRATLGPAGTLVLQELVLYDTGALAEQPLVTAREIRAQFRWAELLSARIRRLEADDLVVYARSNGPMPLSLLSLLPVDASEPSSAPVWIDALDVRGATRPENGAEWPLRIRMTMTGDRPEPVRKLHALIGDTRRLPRSTAEATGAAHRRGAAFGLRAVAAARGTTRVVMHRLVARQGAFMIDAGLLRRFLPALPVELEGDVEVGMGALWASRDELAFGGLRARTLGDGPVTFSLDDLTGTARIAAGALTSAGIRARNGKASIEADVLRRYVGGLPAGVRGRVHTDLGALEVGGRVGLEPMAFRGAVRLGDLTLRAPFGTEGSVALDRLTAAATVDVPLGRWNPAAVAARDGVARWVALTYGKAAVRNLDASWRIDGQLLTADRFTAELFGGHLNGAPAWDLVSQALLPADVRIQSLDAHLALANVSPAHFDAEGRVSGVLHLASTAAGELSGHVDLAFDGPGILRVGEIEQFKKMLAGNFGLEMANLAMQDLKRYPFREGSVHIESSGRDTVVRIKFVREARTAADARPPQKHIINGQEVWVGSLVVPTIDMTIPITGMSLAEILSLVGGLRPGIDTAGDQTQ